MGSDRTVLRPGSPRFSLKETVYLRSSATRGFVEPVWIVNMAFDPARNSWIYTWSYDFGKSPKVSPVRVYESELITVCEALDIQISVLQRRLADLQIQFGSVCPNGATFSVQVAVSENADGTTRPPPPLFGYNEVAYLRESAESNGYLESYRITDLKWHQPESQWAYSMHIKRRPGRTMTIGDRGDMSREFDLVYFESQLCTVCEALPLAIAYLGGAITSRQSRRAGLCNATG